MGGPLKRRGCVLIQPGSLGMVFYEGLSIHDCGPHANPAYLCLSENGRSSMLGHLSDHTLHIRRGLAWTMNSKGRQ